MSFFYLTKMLSFRGRDICMRLEVKGKCALPREDNIADKEIPM